MRAGKKNVSENLNVSFKITGLGWLLFSLEAGGNEEWEMNVLTTEHLAALRRVTESQGC